MDSAARTNVRATKGFGSTTIGLSTVEKMAGWFRKRWQWDGFWWAHGDEIDWTVM